jgi:hypothetical protein
LDVRHIIAYAILCAMAISFATLWLLLTRERRSNRRAWRRHDRGSKARREAARAAGKA